MKREGHLSHKRSSMKLIKSIIDEVKLHSSAATFVDSDFWTKIRNVRVLLQI